MNSRRYDLSAIFNSCASCEGPVFSSLPMASPASGYPTASAYSSGCGCKNKDVGIFNQNANESAVVANAPLIIGQTAVQGGAVSYNPLNGVYTANCAGSYLFMWTAEVSGGAVTGETESVLVTLESAGGGTVYGSSGAIATQIAEGTFPAMTLVGFALVRAEAGASFALYNRSGADITLDAVSGAATSPSFAGTVTVIKIA